ncbi:MAG: RluA family pseudouridine synthase [Clostridia bacterium]|nr:RluA family pseudouridine synthase [Clostridia bacterium]
MDITIGCDFAGLTVKDWLYKNGISRGLITQLKKREDGITVNGEHVTVRRVLAVGDILSISADDRAEDENELLVPTKMSLDIIYEDDDMIAVNKPPDMATHPSLGHFDDTLANGLAYYFGSRGIPFVFRAINRLDRDTSGAVLIAKNRISAAHLTALMQSGKIRKTYVAILSGRISPESGTVTAAIRRREASIMLRETCEDGADGAKSAVTEYKTLFASDNASIVQAEPITGRTHQLRVHFAYLGCPIVGDGFYGSAETVPTEYDRLMTRQALHAAALEIDFGDRVLRISAELPYDMEKLKRYIKGA